MSRKTNYTTIPRDGLVGEWLLDGNANDTSGNGNNGTATDVTWVGADKGYVNQCGSFNGSSSYINNGITNLITQDYTLSVWVNQSNSQSNTSPLSAWSDDGYMIWFPNNSNDLRLYSNTTNDTYSNIQTNYLNDGNWHLITGIKKGQLSKLYIDGKLVGTGGGSLDNNITHSNEETLIGLYGKSGGYGDYYAGNIGLARIYNRVLLDKEIKNLYQEGLRKFGPTRGLKNNGIFVGSLPNLEQGKVLEISKPQVGGTYYDQTGNGYNGTATNVTDSQIGQANVMSFNGSSSYIDTNYILGGNTSTINLFYTHTVVGDNTYILSQGYKNATDGRIGLEIKSDNTLFLFQNSNGVIQISSHPLTIGKTYMISIVRHSQDLWELYLNGISQGTDTGGKVLTNESILLMKLDTSYRDGKIGLLRIYNRALLPKEVQQLYYLQKGNFIN